MNRPSRIACIVGAMAAILLALTVPAMACDSCQQQVQFQQVYAAPLVQQFVAPVYAQPLIQRQVIQQSYVQPVVAQQVLFEKVRFAPQKQRVVQRIERAPRREVVRSRSVQSVRSR